MNAPCTFVLKNNGITQFFDVSYLSFSRNGDKSVLKQNIKTSFGNHLKKLNKTKDKVSDYFEYVKKYEFKYDCQRMIMSKKGKTLKQLGVMTNAQQKRAKKAVECLVSMVTLSKDKSLRNKSKQYLAFVTLTLPSKQVHSDTVIRKCLVRYIENLQKTYGVKHYVWKAEPQKNGNIHFHLMVDRYLHYTVHRKLWNKQIDKLGYLDAYCEKHGNRNPITEDVRGLKDKRSVSNYLLKYMTKAEFNKRPILGAIWGLANATKKLDYPRTSEGHASFYAINDLLRTHHFKNVVSEDFFAHFVGKTYEVLSKEALNVWNEVKKHFFLMNNLIKPKKIISKPFIRVKTYETIEESLKASNLRKKAAKEERERVKKEKQLLTTYDPYKANQFDIFAPL
ncbi:rolling circle replication-associated protein [Tenacibaculum ovolyticum]|uniref:rolling circle replication-associated protein n=1 Tax=Tenacibaculum ovolyticum TaxID=104270 RepID=UPI003BAB9567